MKKIITGIILSALLCSGSAAMAATYNSEANTVTDDGAKEYQTVIITKKDDASDEGIVYVNQTDSGCFSETMSFALKDGVEDGYYTITLGGGKNGTKLTSEFYIGEIKPEIAPIEADNAYVEHDKEGSYTAAYGWDSVDGSAVKTIVIELNDGKARACKLDTKFSEGSAMKIGIKISEVPDNNVIKRAYLSSKSIQELGGTTTE